MAGSQGWPQVGGGGLSLPPDLVIIGKKKKRFRLTFFLTNLVQFGS